MGYSDVRNLKKVDTYEKCAKLFELPALTGAYWEGHERPLRDKRQWHYRVQKITTGYEVMLYGTVMARYSHPVEGKRKTMYQWDKRSTSTQFLSRVVKAKETMEYLTTTGTRVVVPLKAAGWVNLVFQDDKLIIAESEYPDVYSYVSTLEDEENRKTIKKDSQFWIQAALVRLANEVPEINLRVLQRDYGPFTKLNVNINTYRAAHQLFIGYIEQPNVEAWMQVANKVQEHAYGSALWWDRPAPSLETIEKALLRCVLKMTHADKKSGEELMPKFPEAI